MDSNVKGSHPYASALWSMHTSKHLSSVFFENENYLHLISYNKLQRQVIDFKAVTYCYKIYLMLVNTSQYNGSRAHVRNARQERIAHR